MFSTRRKLEENPKVKSNPLSVLSFSYLNNLFKKGAKTPLEAQDRNFKLLKLRLEMWNFNRRWPWCHDFEPFKIFYCSRTKKSQKNYMGISFDQLFVVFNQFIHEGTNVPLSPKNSSKNNYLTSTSSDYDQGTLNPRSFSV